VSAVALVDQEGMTAVDGRRPTTTAGNKAATADAGVCGDIDGLSSSLMDSGEAYVHALSRGQLRVAEEGVAWVCMRRQEEQGPIRAIFLTHTFKTDFFQTRHRNSWRKRKTDEKFRRGR